MSLLSYITGSVLVECEGGYPERFLNAAANAKLPLWDIRVVGASLWCHAPAGAYRLLRPAARAAGVRMRVRGRYGLPFAMRRRHFRLGVPVGLLLFALLLGGLSSRVWVVTVTGNHTVSESEIRAVLHPLGVYEGADFNRVSLPDVQLTALQQLPQLSWLTVNQSGSIATVEVREHTAVDPLEETTPANLVAACDGVILRINTTTGQAMVKAGDAVSRGTLLISGVMESNVGPQLKRAAGSVLARTSHTLTVTVPLKDTVTRVERTLTRPTLSLFGWNIPLYAGGALEGNPETTTEHRPVCAGGVRLPLGLTVVRHTYFSTQPITRPPEEALALAEERLAKQEQTLRDTLTVETRTPHTQITADAVTLTVVYTGTQELAISTPIV